MSTLEILDQQENIEAIPLKERTVFQIKLMEKMLGENFINKTRQEKTDAELEWADNYAKLVSDIIDRSEYIDIKRLIMSGQYEEAIDLIIPVIKQKLL